MSPASPIKALVLDFDGLLVESVDIKDNAFAETFNMYPEKRNEIMAYHFANNTVIRYVKLRHIVENIIGEPYTPAREQSVIERFTSYTRAAIIACPFVPGAPEFLDRFHGRIPLHLASATPIEELVCIVENRGLSRYFTSIHGAPRKKPDIFAELGLCSNAMPHEMLFLGDSIGDVEAARESGLRFVGRRNKDDLSGIGFPVFNDLFAIAEYVEKSMRGS